MLIANIFTEYTFRIDANNVYTRGNGYWLSFVLQYVAYLLILIRALVPTLDVRTLRRRRMRNSAGKKPENTAKAPFLCGFLIDYC